MLVEEGEFSEAKTVGSDPIAPLLVIIYNNVAEN